MASYSDNAMEWARMQAGAAGIAFEQETARRLSALGWTVRTTLVTGDFGADLLLQADLLVQIGSEVVAVQCKDYGSAAGIGAVQEAHLARAHYRTGGAMVVARSGFTKAAVSADVQLITPASLFLGSKWDRTPARRKLEEAERKQNLSELWRVYDKTLTQFEWEAKHRSKSLTICAIAAVGCAALAIFHDQPLWWGAAAYLIYLVIIPPSGFSDS